jgi:predicted permease
MTSFLNDLRFGLRTLAKNPGFAALAILTLAIGIGLNTAIFSVVNAFLFRPMPVHAPEELAGVYNYEPGGFITHTPLAFPDFQDFRESNQSFSQIFGYAAVPLALDRGDDNRLITGEIVTENYFETLGINPVIGRVFSSGEGSTPGSDPEVVLSSAAWNSQFGRNPAVIGSTIRLDGTPFTIIGVAPPSYRGMYRGMESEMWIPMGMYGSIHFGSDELHNRDGRWLFAMGRLKPGRTVAQAQADLQVIAKRLKTKFPLTNKNRNVALFPANEVKILPGVDRVLYASSAVLMAIVSLVLLIACANVANMMVARATARRREIAVRLPMGAGRARLCRQLLTESMLIALPGGGLGQLAAVWSNRMLNAFRLPIPVKLALGLSVDYRVLAFTLGVSLITAVIFGLAPALRMSRTDLAETLKEEGSATPGRKQKRRLHGALVVAQVSLSLVVLICAGLSVRSMWNAGRIDPGFDPAGVVDASFDVSMRGLTPEQGAEFYKQLRQRADSLPGVISTAYASNVPLSFEIRDTEATAEGKNQSLEPRQWPAVDNATVGSNYFATMRVGLVEGREFSERDTSSAPRVAVINQTLARQFWPNEDAIGKRLRISGDKENMYQVIGVVRDGKYRTLGEDARPYLYLSLLQRYEAGQRLLVRTAGDPRALLPVLRQEAKQLDPRVPILGLQTLQETTSVSLLLPKTGAALFGLFGLIGAVLASVGIYAVVSFTAGQRTREIGIRMSLGAQRRDVLKLVLGDGMRLTLIGVAIGLAITVAFTRLLSAILFGIRPTDALTLAGVSLLFLAVALLAGAIPARRAARVDPLVALRHD